MEWFPFLLVGRQSDDEGESSKAQSKASARGHPDVRDSSCPLIDRSPCDICDDSWGAIIVDGGRTEGFVIPGASKAIDRAAQRLGELGAVPGMKGLLGGGAHGCDC